jgi:phage-related tail fiber protein
MAEQFYTIPTAIGKSKIANSIVLGTKVNLTTLKVGDSNGAYYNPTESQTDLVHSVYSCNITSVEVDPINPNWITITSAIPSDVGGFSIREAGVFDDSGKLIAIGKYPETYKPVAADGSTKELYIKMTLEITNSSSVELKIDPTVILATKSDINILTNSIASITTQLSEKASIYISETLPAIADRKEKTMYLKITDTISSGTTSNIKVSPTMGLKLE